MNAEELKQEIAQRTGIPVTLLTGETVEENIAQAKALLAYKREYDAQRPKTNSEKFSELFKQLQGIEEQDEASAALTRIEEQVRRDAGDFPILQDGGSANVSLGDPRPARELFSEWASKKNAFDPRNKGDGWKVERC